MSAQTAHPRALLRQLFDAAVDAAQPRLRLPAFLPPPPKGRTLVVGAGKGSAAMAQALEALWPLDAPLSGHVVTRDGHIPPRTPGTPQRITVHEARHPVPDARSEQAARLQLDWLRQQNPGPDDLVIALMSGGGSALLCLPVDGLTLADKQRIHRELLASGAPIEAMNTVRKHLSAIKGGRLALAAGLAPVLTLAISDVPGDDPGTIASGPTLPDASTCADALAIIDRYGLTVPDAVRAALASGALETPAPDHPAFATHRCELIATPLQSLQAAAQRARELGVTAHILSDVIEGESAEVGRVHAALALSSARGDSCFKPPCVLLSGGETTVTLPPTPPGQAAPRGGRGSEFALALAHALQGAPGIWALAADTDGIDGVESNAGAFVNPDTLARAAALGLSARDHLHRHDAWPFFNALDDLLVTGPTHTNVNDFRAIWVESGDKT
ncbi:glycerate kinase type-2 family protein [Amphibiibacter pelophylacis]|uniref:Glycerate kinase n=1 Tax=Amphibiibacter pelophylacis TaxID=1799477 RepID=A0ACC6NZY2_9BURK